MNINCHNREEFDEVFYDNYVHKKEYYVFIVGWHTENQINGAMQSIESKYFNGEKNNDFDVIISSRSCIIYCLKKSRIPFNDLKYYFPLLGTEHQDIIAMAAPHEMPQIQKIYDGMMTVRQIRGYTE